MFIFNLISKDNDEYVLDHFQQTPIMSTYSFGFVISQLTQVNVNNSISLESSIRIWARPNFHRELVGLHEKIVTILSKIRDYWDKDYPLCKLDIVALPGLSVLKPIDNYGLIVFKFVLLVLLLGKSF